VEYAQRDNRNHRAPQQPVGTARRGAGIAATVDGGLRGTAVSDYRCCWRATAGGGFGKRDRCSIETGGGGFCRWFKSAYRIGWRWRTATTCSFNRRRFGAMVFVIMIVLVWSCLSSVFHQTGRLGVECTPKSSINYPPNSTSRCTVSPICIASISGVQNGSLGQTFCEYNFV